MRTLPLVKLHVLFILGAVFIFPNVALADPNINRAIVKVYAVRNPPDYDNPWNRLSPESVSGSGCILDGRRILTNAHVVADQKFIEVKREGNPNRYPARVLYVAHEVDLALLTVDDPTFFSGVEPLQLSELPELQQVVLVYGFPTGGNALSITKGVISRIEHQMYSYSLKEFLMVQIDAAINPGNSGGPAIVDNKVVGIAVQSLKNAQNIGYIIPTPIINHVLKDLADGRYDGFPVLGVSLQDLSNPDLKERYGLSENQHGALVTRINSGSPVEGTIQAGDVLLTIDGRTIEDGISVEFRPGEWISLEYYVQARQIGEKIGIEISRNGKTKTVEVALDKTAHDFERIPLEFDASPRYFIFGGMVFTPLTINFLMTWGDEWPRSAPANLLSLLESNYKVEKGQEVVLLHSVLAHEINRGYHDLSQRTITKVNGRKVRNLKELIAVAESDAEGPYVVFEDADGNQFALNKKRAQATHRQILATYQIPQDRSWDLLSVAHVFDHE